MSRVRRPRTPSWSLCWQPSPLAAVAPYLPAPGSPVCRSRPAEDEASSLQQRFVSIVKAVCPSVVQIAAPLALGSGVVFDALGDVVTNALFVKDHKPVTSTGRAGTAFGAAWFVVSPAGNQISSHASRQGGGSSSSRPTAPAAPPAAKPQPAPQSTPQPVTPPAAKPVPKPAVCAERKGSRLPYANHDLAN